MDDDNNDSEKKAQLAAAKAQREASANVDPSSPSARLLKQHEAEVLKALTKTNPWMLSQTFDEAMEAYEKKHPEMFAAKQAPKREMPPPAEWAQYTPREQLEWNTTGKPPARFVKRNLSDEQQAIANLPAKEMLALANKRIHDAAVKREADKRAKKI